MNDATEHQIKQMSEQVRKYKLCTQHKNQGDVTLTKSVFEAGGVIIAVFVDIVGVGVELGYDVPALLLY